MKTGVVFPQTEIGDDPVAIRDFAIAIEEMGFDHLIAYDHVVGADISERPDWNGPYTHESMFHEPLTLFSFLAGITTRLEFATGIVILPQRQTVLAAKQAASIDIFSGGRLRIGVGIGWNVVEYEALDVPFDKRGARLDEQIEYMRRLWTERVFSFDGEFHKLSQGGLYPLPVQRPIPIWVGGLSDAAMQRAARLGDGWMPVWPAAMAEQKIAEFKSAVEDAGRNPTDVGFENIIFVGDTVGGPRRSYEDAVSDAGIWKSAGADRVSLHTTGAGLGGVEGHLAFLRSFKEAGGL